MRHQIGLLIVGMLLAVGLAAPAAEAAYTASVTGSTANFTGDNNFNQLVIRANLSGTLLAHNRFSQGDTGFASNEDFDSSAAGDQTLANTGTSTLNAVGGTGLDAFQVFSGNNSGNPVVQVELNFDGGSGPDFPLDMFLGSANDSVTLGGSTVTGVAGQPIDYVNVDGAAVRMAGGNDTLNLASSATGGAQILAGAGDDSFVPAEGTTLGHRFDGGPGVDTINYSGWTSPVSVGTPTMANFLATLDGNQEVPPNASSNEGDGSVLFTDLSNPDQPFNLQLQIGTFTPAQVTDSHIHSGAPGVNGPVIFPIGPGSSYSGTGSLSFSTNDVIDPDVTEPALRDGNTYFNVHTQAFSGGEIRGRIVLDPDFGYGQPATATTGVTGAESFVGGLGADVIHGNPLANSIRGGGGGDQLFGEPGDDSFDEGASASGADTIDGGTGIDGVAYDARSSSVNVNLGSNVAGEDGEAAEGDNVLDTVENAIGGSGADDLLGNGASNLLTGGPGADALRGAGGDDTLAAVDGQADLVIDCGAGSADVANRDPASTDADSIVSGCETVSPALTPIEPPPPGDTVGTLLKLAPRAAGKGKRIVLDPGGAASCPSGATAVCTVTVRATSKIPGSALQARIRKTLGAASDSLAPGESSDVIPIMVSAKLSRAWRRAGKLKVSVSAVLDVPGGTGASQSATRRIKAPKRG